MGINVDFVSDPNLEKESQIQANPTKARKYIEQLQAENKRLRDAIVNVDERLQKPEPNDGRKCKKMCKIVYRDRCWQSHKTLEQALSPNN